MGVTDTLSAYQAVLQSTLDPLIIIDRFGTIQRASDSVERVFGWTVHEMVGKNIRIIMPEPHHSAHDDYLARYRETGQTNILNRTREFECVRKDGTIFPIEISVSRVEFENEPPLFIGILRDISERKQAERELQLVQSITYATATAGDLGEALRTTLERICRATGWEYGEAWFPSTQASGGGEMLIDSPVWHAVDASLDEFQQAVQGTTFQPGQGLPGRVWQSRQIEWVDNVGDRDLFSRATPASKAGLRTGLGIPIVTADCVVAVLVFLTRSVGRADEQLLRLLLSAVAPLGPVIERKSMADKLARQNDHLEELVKERTTALEQTHAQLRQADRLASIGTLAAGLGHDMNNVLLPVRARLDVLAAECAETNCSDEHIRAIRASVDYLQHLADGLHMLSANPDQSEAMRGTTDITEWWRRVEPLLSRALPKTAAFEMNLESALPKIGVAPHRLTQALLNLFVNAGEALPAKGGRVRAEVVRDGNEVRISVRDNGCGMSPEVTERAMDPFYTTKKRGLGTGLGLALVHGVARGAGGRVEIDSTVGTGTAVHLWFPIVAPVSAGDDDSAHVAMRIAICVADARLRTLIASLLSSADTIETDIVELARVNPDVLIVDAHGISEDSAEVFLRTPSHRLILLGRPSWQSTNERLHIVDPPDSYDLLRHVLEHI